MTISITLHDLTIEKLRAIAEVLGGDTVVTTLPVEPTLTLNDEPATEEEVVEAIESTIGNDAPPPPPSLFDQEPTTSGVELDSAGMPWDKRIHASTKTKVKAGTWKKKKGVDDALVTQVEAELKGTNTSGEVKPADIPAPPPVETAVSFNDVMALATSAITNGDIDQDELIEIVSKHGGGDQGLQSLFAAPDAVAGVYTELKGLIDG